jgi:DHA1 family inner membrane transport protein
MAVTLIWFTGGFGLFIYVGEFFHRAFGIPVEQAGLAYLVVGVVGIIAARSSGAVQERIGARRVLLIGLSVGGTSVLLVPLAPALPVALLLFAAWASGTWFGVPAMQSIVAGLSSTARGTMLAFNSSALNLGSVIGPIVSGRIIDDAGFATAGLWSGFLFACALIIAVQVLPHREPEPSRAPTPAAGG